MHLKPTDQPTPKLDALPMQVQHMPGVYRPNWNGSKPSISHQPPLKPVIRHAGLYRVADDPVTPLSIQAKYREPKRLEINWKGK